MSDTNFSYMEVSAKRKKRNQFISVLIIVAIVLLGVIAWGWIELQKSRNAERIKHALNSQVEPGFREPDAALEPPPAETGSVVVEDAPAVQPPPPPPEPPKVAEAPRPVAPPAPKPVSKPAPAPVANKEPVVPPAPKPVPVQEAAPPKEEPVQVAVHKPDPIPSTPKPVAPKPVQPEPELPKAVAPPTPSTPTETPKVFPPEDLPQPAKAVPTEEAKLAVVLPPAPEAAAAGAPEPSSSFKLGMAAYRQQDYVNAIRSFAAVSKPATKKRGTLERDEYVQANFLKGMALLKVGHMSEAVTAFQNVLEFEKYYPMANMNLGICYVELKQYAKAHQAFEAVIRDQNRLEPANYDDVMQRTKYFWAVAWTRLYKNSTNPDKQNYYRSQAIQKWKDYQVWFSKNDKYREENLRAENYLKSLSSL